MSFSVDSSSFSGGGGGGAVALGGYGRLCRGWLLLSIRSISVHNSSSPSPVTAETGKHGSATRIRMFAGRGSVSPRPSLSILVATTAGVPAASRIQLQRGAVVLEARVAARPPAAAPHGARWQHRAHDRFEFGRACLPRLARGRRSGAPLSVPARIRTPAGPAGRTACRRRASRDRRWRAASCRRGAGARDPLTDQRVDQARLADIRAAYEGDLGKPVMRPDRSRSPRCE